MTGRSHPSSLEDKAFVLLVAAVTAAFAWIVWPFYGAVLWGAAIAILFAPLYRRLCKAMRERENVAALTTLVIIVVIVIVPLMLVGALLVRQAAGVYDRIQAGELDFGAYLLRAVDALPQWAVDLLRRFGIANLGDLQERVAAGLQAGSQFLAQQLLDVGQNTFNLVVGLFVMLYLLFFLLRDGDELAARIQTAIPLRPEQQNALIGKLTTVVRAMIKGTLSVAVVQGALGGLILWVLGVPASALWGVVMGLLSLLPAIGAPVVWFPLGVYLLATGRVWQGIVLLAFGALVISLVDNVLRPILVGKDTKIPDYVVLISTLGGLAIFGMNGLLLGPLIAALFLVAWDIFTASRRA
ncbi:MAG: AI-2E family transporter [Gammaproteobacteria bacterium]|nr:AI-2E family transporter [Gammaproteobacteria bacterium]